MTRFISGRTPTTNAEAFERALAVSRAIERSGAPGALKIYKDEGHSLSQKAHADAVETVARFLSEGLRKPRQLAESKSH